MKILLSEFDTKDLNSIHSKLIGWGFHAIVHDGKASTAEILRKQPNIQILIMGDTFNNALDLIPEIRKRSQYIYILVLLTGDIDSYKEDQRYSGIDDFIKKPDDLDQLRFYLFGIQYTIGYSTSHFLPGIQSDFRLIRQAINLDYLFSSSTVDKEDVREQLYNLLKRSNEFIIDSNSITGNVLEKTLIISEELGTEQLTDWLIGILFLKQNPDYGKLLSFNLLQYQLREIQSRIFVAIKSLEEFGFFKKASDTVSILQGKRILLVEDMKYNRVLLTKILMKQKCAITEAVNGQDALNIWQEQNDFEIIIMDMNMPIMDGFTATREIRKIEREKSLKRTPIIALTALAMRGDKELCLEAGTDDYLPKPVEALSLIKTCENILLGKKSRKPQKKDYNQELHNIDRILVKVNNQISLYSLKSVFETLGIKYEICNSAEKVMGAVAESDFSLIVLEADHDLELAYHIQNNFPHQYIALISNSNRTQELISSNFANNFRYPLKFEQVLKVLKFYSDKHQQAKKDAEKLADGDSLDKIKRQVSITDAVHKSDNQLAVWQKAFRKIGGDLVLSHQFNLHGKFGLILGDVAGHDIQSGYTASWFSGLVEGIWGQNPNPYKFLVNLNNLFAHDTEEENKRFVCALVLLWDPIRQKLFYANAGIPGGILIKKDTGKGEAMEWTGVPIGMFPDMDMFDHGELDFTEGDKLIIATDGVLEAIPRENISELSESRSSESAQLTLDAIVDFVTRSIEITDDLTIAVFEAKIPEHPVSGYRKTIKSDFRDVDQAVEYMNQFIKQNAKNIFDWPMISVAIREALLNAVEHGNKSNPSYPVDIDFELKEKQMIVTISDCGSGFDLSTEKKRLEKEGDLRIHGRGIEMMENISKSVSFLGGGIKLVFESHEP
ncbi:SpoIIE family protein phosphatase [bacterium]|nr:SpoIIE family protein phosphatase [bacterium]